jgi:hypothetical protein
MPNLWGENGGPHSFLAHHTATSVIEEKGEGFENGKNQFKAANGSLQPKPSIVVRLKICPSYKKIAEWGEFTYRCVWVLAYG